MGKERSPNFPFVGLSAAVQAAKKLWEAERRSPVTLETVAKAFGHSTLSGPATSKVAAIRQYGLIEQVSPGKYRASDIAITLALKKPGDPEYDEALQKAALSPPLFAELFAAYPEASDDTLHYHLVKERGFSPEGAARLIKSLRETISVAKLVPTSYNDPDDESRKRDADRDRELDRDEDHKRDRAEDRERDRKRNGGGGAGNVTYSWPLDDADRVEVTFVGNPGTKPTRRDLEALIEMLEARRKRTPEAAPESPEGAE